MANIMITEGCNLRCPYCFANKFVNRVGKNNITQDAFNRALDFILRDGSHRHVGIIGGEPTIHPLFDDLMKTAILDERAESVVLYTNGILLDEHWDVVCHPKTRLLINCNSPTNTGKRCFERMVANIRTLVEDKLAKDRTTLGINMFGVDFEYGYMHKLLSRFGFDRVRVSVVVPNSAELCSVPPLDYFRQIKPRVLDFFCELLHDGIVPFFDCNKIPSCLVTDEDVSRIKSTIGDLALQSRIEKTNLMKVDVGCRPVIDIRPDLTAVRCFGLSETTLERISDYKGIKELENHYIACVDAFACNTIHSEACRMCRLRTVLKCSGGCLAYKTRQIAKLRDYATRMMSDASGDVL